MHTVTVNSQGVSTEFDDTDLSVHVALPGELACDMDLPQATCAECGEEDPEDDFCTVSDSEEHELVPTPLTWVNSADISVSESEVRVNISLGDVRGALCMSVWQTPNGNLYLSVPTERDNHVKLTQVSEGTYRVDA